MQNSRIDVCRILFVADVFGRPGRNAVTGLLPGLREELDVDVAIVNVENAAAGAGVTRAIVTAVLKAGADCLTSGNHIWANRDVYDVIEEEGRLLRPANFDGEAPGRGAAVIESRGGDPVLVVNVQGRVFMDPSNCPFRAVDRLLEEHESVRIRFVDFHAEATSEKIGMARYLDGRVSAVVGTHTHVATADERVQAGGTAAITDVGLTGPFDSIIGVRADAALRRLVRGLPTRFEPATDDVRLSGVLVSVDRATGRATDIQRVQRAWEA